MKTATSKTSWVALSILLLLGNLTPALSQVPDSGKPESSGSGEAASATPAKDPESGSVSAGDTLSKLGDKIEKQSEKQENDPSKTTNKVPSVDDLLQSIKQANPQSIEQKPAPVNEGISLPAKEPVLLNPGATPIETPRGSEITTSMTKPPVAAPAAVPANKAPAPGKLTVRGGKLFGRIEQIASEGEVTMPVLKAQTPKLDPRGKPLAGFAADTGGYSGTVATSFPVDFRGSWGGTMSVWSYRSSPAYVAIDRAEAVQSAQILKAGRSGTVNFSFYRDIYNRIAVQPAKVLLSVPMKDTHTFSQMMSGSGGDSMGAMSGLFTQMMGNMEAPVVMLHFGKAATDSLQTGVSGNDFRQEVAKNVLRDLAPGVVEEQIITKWVTKTTSGKVNSGYDESVMRFKKVNDSQLYVLLASVKYSSSGKYLSKLIMSGTVDKGRRMQENPYGNMNQMMGQMMNQGSLQQLLGGSGGGRPIQVPQGGIRMPGGAGGAGNAADSLNDILKQLNQLQR